jgi:hypothetical protein
MMMMMMMMQASHGGMKTNCSDSFFRELYTCDAVLPAMNSHFIRLVVFSLPLASAGRMKQITAPVVFTETPILPS